LEGIATDAAAEIDERHLGEKPDVPTEILDVRPADQIERFRASPREGDEVGWDAESLKVAEAVFRRHADGPAGFEFDMPIPPGHRKLRRQIGRQHLEPVPIGESKIVEGGGADVACGRRTPRVAAHPNPEFPCGEFPCGVIQFLAGTQFG
jgi:hypothetical protein